MCTKQIICSRKNEKRCIASEVPMKDYTDITITSKSNPSTPKNDNDLYSQLPEKMCIGTLQNVKIDEKIGSGSFGTISF